MGNFLPEEGDLISVWTIYSESEYWIVVT